MIDRSLNYGRKQIIDLAALAFEGHLQDQVKVLDLGAGPGQDLLGARSVLPSAELHAIENAPGCIELLKQHQITHHCLDIERDLLPFANESLDLVVINQVLEHTKDVFWIFHEISRTLKVGGSVIVGVPNLAAFHNRVLLMAGRQPSPIKTASAHVRGFTLGDLESFQSSCFPGGYQTVSVRGSNFYPFPGWLAKPAAQLWPTGAWSIFILWKKMKPYKNSFLEFPIREKLETRFYLGGNFS